MILKKYKMLVYKVNIEGKPGSEAILIIFPSIWLISSKINAFYHVLY